MSDDGCLKLVAAPFSWNSRRVQAAGVCMGERGIKSDMSALYSPAIHSPILKHMYSISRE